MGSIDDNTSLENHQHNLLDHFDHITFLADNDKIDNAVELLLKLHYADLADFLDNANHKICETILHHMGRRLNPETLPSLSDGSLERVIVLLGLRISSELINKLSIEESIDILERVDHDLKTEIIDHLHDAKRKQIIEGFQYPEGTAGRVLEKNFIAIKQQLTVKDAIQLIANQKKDSALFAVIVVDSKSKPVGTIAINTLLQNMHQDWDKTQISELMNKENKIIDTYTQLNDLIFLFKQYSLTILPVTNRNGKLVGTVSIDNMLHIIEEETNNDFLQLGGLNNSDIFQDIYKTVQYRFPWLFVNLLTAMLTATIIEGFNHVILQIVTLAAITPVIASMAGNAGTQVMTVTIAAIIRREIHESNTMRIIAKEIMVCILNSILLSAIGIVILLFITDDIRLGFLFSTSIIVSFAVAGFLGCAIPIILNKNNIDPTTASSVLLTALTDAISFFSFLGLAYLFLI